MHFISIKKLFIFWSSFRRTLCYPRARIGIEQNDGWRGDHEIIEYEGTNQMTKKWGKVRTYGGKLTENVVQAIARDILGLIILRADAAGLNIVFHIHDEIVVEAEPGQTLQDVENIFSKPIDWCRDLPLKGLRIIQRKGAMKK